MQAASEKHPDKTFIGKIERCFDFLGYHFSLAGLAVAKQTVANFIEKASRLYEQERRMSSGASPLEMYVKRWLGWVRGVETPRRGLPRGACHFRRLASWCLPIVCSAGCRLREIPSVGSGGG